MLKPSPDYHLENIISSELFFFSEPRVIFVEKEKASRDTNVG
jgi:hypothetical protein